MKTRKPIVSLLLLISLLPTNPLWAEEVTLVKDIGDAGIGGYRGSPVALNGYLYFLGEDLFHGVEIWRSNGTTEGTELFADIWKGPESIFGKPKIFTSDYQLPKLVRSGEYIYFPGNDGRGNKGLWKTNGIIEGTQPVKNIPSEDRNPNLGNLTAVEGKLFFTANQDKELWVSDGTEDGTILYMEADAENEIENFQRLTNVNGELFFFTNHSTKMWKTSSALTDAVELSDFEDSRVAFISETNDEFIEFLYFIITGGRNHQMWKTDGTAIGTVPIENTGLHLYGPIITVGDKIYFVADSPETGEEIWITDGTDNGARLFADVNPGPDDGYPHDLIYFSGELFFTALNGTSGGELFRSDGTPEGTILLKDIYPGKRSGVGGEMVVFGDHLYFRAFDPIKGVSLWKTDGTTDGTKLVHSINHWTIGSYINSLTPTESLLFFRANTSVPSNGEMWVSDGTKEGTNSLQEFIQMEIGAFPLYLTNVNGTVYFQAYTEELGRELWKTDGTQEGTGLVMDIAPGPDSSTPYPLGQFNGILYFAVTLDYPKGELWRTDGTKDGTWAIKSTWGEFTEAYPRQLEVANDTLFFFVGNSRSDTLRGLQLWKSDGTTEGTEIVLLPFEQHLVGFNTKMKASGNQVFFYEGYEGLHEELWRTDGTAEGTFMVMDINPGPEDSYITDIDGILFFRAYSETHGNEIWRSDGTEEGTYMVKDIYPGPLPEFENPGYFHLNIDFEQSRLVYSDGHIYFLADDGIHGGELWRTDGTTEGTMLVRDINPGPEGSFPFNVTDVNGEIYFIAYPQEAHNELWKSNGTEEGTVPIANLNSAPGVDWVSHFPANNFTSFKDQLFFVNYRIETGSELYTVKLTEADSYFPLSVDIGNGWRESDWLGIFFAAHLPWIWHTAHGWLYFPEVESDEKWFWDLKQGWLLTSKFYYPLIYRYNDDSWLRYQTGTTDPRVFFNFRTGQREEIERSE